MGYYTLQRGLKPHLDSDYLIRYVLCYSSFNYSYYGKNFLAEIKRCWRSSTFLLRENALIRNRDSNLFLWGISMLCNVITFEWRNFFRVIAIFWDSIDYTGLLKFLNLKVFMIMSYYDHFLNFSTVWCYYQCSYNNPGSFCYLLRSWKETLCCKILCNTTIHHSFEDTCNVNKKDCYI